jgi:hypothetical protein
MIDIIHVPINDAINTACVVIAARGANDELSIKWITAVAKFGYRWSPEHNRFVRSV